MHNNVQRLPETVFIMKLITGMFSCVCHLRSGYVEWPFVAGTEALAKSIFPFSKNLHHHRILKSITLSISHACPHTGTLKQIYSTLCNHSRIRDKVYESGYKCQHCTSSQSQICVRKGYYQFKAVISHILSSNSMTHPFTELFFSLRMLHYKNDCIEHLNQIYNTDFGREELFYIVAIININIA